MFARLTGIAAAVAVIWLTPQAAFCDATSFFQTNLTSDLPGVAADR